MTYIHRNGEREAPAVDGLYWFKGITESLFPGETIQRPIQVLTASGETLAWNDSVLSFREINEFDGQWWGPVVPPWGQGL